MPQQPVRFVKPFEGSGTLIGIDKEGLFETGIVYEVISILGELIIRKAGRTTATTAGGDLYGQDVLQLVLSGEHLLTDREKENG